MSNNVNNESLLLARLDRLDWDKFADTWLLDASSFKNYILDNKEIALQLASGAYTDLIGIAGSFHMICSLHAEFPPEGSKEKGVIRGFLVEPELNKKRILSGEQKLSFKGHEIKDEIALEALFSQSVVTVELDGEDCYYLTRSFANAGGCFVFPDDKEHEWLLSIHEPTNKLVGITSDDVAEQLRANPEFYGAKLSEEQIERLSHGCVVNVDGCHYEGLEFSACAQFDVAKNRLVDVYPSWIYGINHKNKYVDLIPESEKYREGARHFLPKLLGPDMIKKVHKRFAAVKDYGMWSGHIFGMSKRRKGPKL